jgi:hypothetical protein
MQARVVGTFRGEAIGVIDVSHGTPVVESGCSRIDTLARDAHDVVEWRAAIEERLSGRWDELNVDHVIHHDGESEVYVWWVTERLIEVHQALDGHFRVVPWVAPYDSERLTG